jgi:hypothetical protein
MGNLIELRVAGKNKQERRLRDYRQEWFSFPLMGDQEANRLKAEAKKCCFWLLFARELQSAARRSALAAAGRAM